MREIAVELIVGLDGDFTHRQVIYIGFRAPVIDPQQTRELLQREREDLIDTAADEAGIARSEGKVREPERCTASNANGEGALACGEAQPN